MEIAVLAGAGVVPPIEIVGKIKGAEVYGILMDYTALCVIFILYIDLTLEILNRTEIPVAVIRIWWLPFQRERRMFMPVSLTRPSIICSRLPVTGENWDWISG